MPQYEINYLPKKNLELPKKNRRKFCFLLTAIIIFVLFIRSTGAGQLETFIQTLKLEGMSWVSRFCGYAACRYA